MRSSRGRFPGFICVAAVALALLLPAPARADDMADCTKLSFAPLDRNIPVCTRLIDDAATPEDRLITALLARAEAYRFAVTYRGTHKVTPEQLAQKARADLDRAIGLLRVRRVVDAGLLQGTLRDRAALLLSQGQAEAARADYDAALESASLGIVPLLYGRALALKALKRYGEAIADLDTVVRLTAGDSSHRNWIFARGEMHEAAGNRTAAAADYRETLRLDRGHAGAARALKKLDVR